MPKEFSGRVIGEKDGILLVHSSACIEFVRQLRKFLILLQKERVSGHNRDDKQANLLEFIKSPRFDRFIKGVERDVRELGKLQEIEEKDHAKLWATRKLLVSKIEDARSTSDAEIAAIVQETKEPMPLELVTPEFIRRKKKARLS